MNISMSSEDFSRLMAAAEYGIKKGDGFMADYVVRNWRETFDRLNSMPLDDGRTQEQRDEAFIDRVHEECRQHGCD